MLWQQILNVQNIEKDSSYTVDVKIGLCSCYVGFNGAPCKHQSAVIQQFNNPFFLPTIDSNQRV